MIKDLLLSIDETVEPKSLEIGSDELNSMRSLVDALDYHGILDLAMELGEKGIFDIRIITYGLYAETLGDTLGSLSNLFESLNILFDSAWHAIGPAERREKYAKTSLSWLLKQVVVDFQTTELEAGPQWQSWISNYTHPDLQAILEGSTNPRTALPDLLGEESGPVLEKLTELTNWFKDFIKQVPLPQEEASPETEEVSQESLSESSSSTATFASSGSLHLDLLVQKIKVFEQVVDNGDLLKAAIVVADINSILENFDPKLYFPAIFSNYYYLLVSHINTITDALDMQDSPQWVVLSNLYHVDKDLFVKITL